MTLTGILTQRGLDCSGDSALPPPDPGLELGRNPPMSDDDCASMCASIS